MKFIHIADVHLDMPLVSLKNKKSLIKKRRTEQKQAFRDVILMAKKEEVDCLFISGDLFEQKFVERNTIEYIISTFQLIPNINVFITPGNHDPYIKNSPYMSYDWPQNVTIFKSEYGLISLDDVDVYGLGFENYEMDDDSIKDIKIIDEDKVNILITHGTLNGASHQYNDIKEKDLKKFDYVALGHIHDKKIDDSRIIYPGSLLSCGFDEMGEHGYVIGEINKDKCEIKFVPLEYRSFEKIELDISKDLNFSDTLDRLDLKENFYEIKLLGTKNYDLEELINEIERLSSYVCVIKNETTLPYDFDSIIKQENLKGIFTRKMLEEMENMDEAEKQETLKTIEMIYNMIG